MRRVRVVDGDRVLVQVLEPLVVQRELEVGAVAGDHPLGAAVGVDGGPQRVAVVVLRVLALGRAVHEARGVCWEEYGDQVEDVGDRLLGGGVRLHGEREGRAEATDRNAVLEVVVAIDGVGTGVV